MKYLEVKDGLSVLIDDILVIESLNGFQSLVHTSKDVYEANFPYGMILRIVEDANVEEPEKEKVNTNLLNGFLENVGTFAG